MGASWRNYKARLKRKHFLKFKTNEERINARPDTVPMKHWKILVAYWNSDQAKAASETNKAHQSQRKCMHTTGSKSFAQVREEERRKNDGEEIDRVQMFRLTHTKRNGKLIEEAVEVVENLEKEKEKSATNSGSSQQIKGPDDIFARVLGKDHGGYVRLYGKGVTPTQLWGTRLGAQQEQIWQSIEEEIAKKLRQEFEKEMEIKLEEQLQHVKATMTQGFCFVLAQIQQQLPGLDIPTIDDLLFTLDTASAHHEPSSSAHQEPNGGQNFNIGDFDEDFTEEE